LARWPHGWQALAGLLLLWVLALLCPYFSRDLGSLSGPWQVLMVKLNSVAAARHHFPEHF